MRKAIKESDNELKKFLKEYPESNKKYKLNKQLIDFNYIPKKFNKKVFKHLKNFL